MRNDKTYRRSLSRLSLVASASSPALLSPSFAATRNPSPVQRGGEDEETRYPGPGTPTGKSRRASSSSVMQTLDKVQMIKWRRIPFVVWIVFTSLVYCCVIYMRMDRDLMKNRFVAEILKDSTTEIVHDEETIVSAVTEDETSKSIATMKQYDHTKNLRRRNVYPEKDSATQSSELVHVVETRFMQQQSNLLELGLARLTLFETFCLPSMLAQTNPNFLWIIRADPNLHPSLVDRMTELLQGRPNFIFIGSNNNPEGFGRPTPKLPFVSFLRIDNVTTSVWNGNIDLVEEAYDRSAAGAVLLETRLDSDDGVNKDFIEMVQSEARKNLIVDNNNNNNDNESEYHGGGNLWRLWCIESRLEWHPLNPYPDTPEIAANNASFPEGYLVYYSEKGCSTPGLTFGYGYGASRESLDRSLNISHLRHDEISKKIRKCNNKSDTVEVECVSRLSELKPGAVRARTTTSAGMANVITGHSDIDQRNGFQRLAKNKRFVKQFNQQQMFWTGLSAWLGVSLDEAKFARSIVVGRMAEIAQDNLKGQCTGGHSCKNGTKAVLGRLAEEMGE